VMQCNIVILLRICYTGVSLGHVPYLNADGA
jgi:hypothetical protein